LQGLNQITEDTFVSNGLCDDQPDDTKLLPFAIGIEFFPRRADHLPGARNGQIVNSIDRSYLEGDALILLSVTNGTQRYFAARKNSVTIGGISDIVRDLR